MCNKMSDPTKNDLNNNILLKNAPAKFRSRVWSYFGFRNTIEDTKTVCKLCFTDVSYKAGNTTNMKQHLLRHHKITVGDIKPESSSISIVDDDFPAKNSTKSAVSGQLRIDDAMKVASKFGLSHPRAKAITNAVGYFIAYDLRPFSIVDDIGFKYLLNVAEPRYTLPSRPHFSETVITGFYRKVRDRVESDIREAEAIAITTDSWTSRAVQSYVTVTGHYISKNWIAKSVSLETKLLEESHTAENLADGLLSCISRWDLKRHGMSPPVTSDNASNIVKAVKLAEISPHIGCFAHTINLSVQKGLKVSQLDRLLGRIRRIVTYFHRSTTATAALKATQTKLELDEVKLIMDVSTRWNSTYDMVCRYLEQQPAVVSALTSKELKKNAKDIVTLSNDDVKTAEAIVDILEPFKTVTKVMCSSNQPTASLIHPMKEMLLTHLTVNDTDSTVIKEVKNTMAADLRPRYSEPEMMDFLLVCSAIDPRFKTLPYVNAARRVEIYDLLRTRAEHIQNEKVRVKIEKDDDISELQSPGASLEHSGTEPPLPQLPSVVDSDDSSPLSPPPKKKCSALQDLFGDVFVTKVEPGKNIHERLELEVKNYISECPISLNSSPLEWWKVNEDKYPLLSIYARYILCIPATSVASERIFSTSGDIVTAQRATLSSDNVEMLVFLAKNIEISDLK